MKNYSLIEKYLGYQNKKDVSNTDPQFLVVGSKNVIVSDGEKIRTRGGTTVDGQTSNDLLPIVSSYDWNTSTGQERNLRSLGGELQFRYINALGVISYITLASSLTSIKFRFAEWWSSAEAKDLLLFVDGTNNIYQWSGATSTVLSNTATTLTLQGTKTWAENRFLLAGTRQVIINGVSYAYTGGEGTTTLTGLVGLPLGITAGTVVIQGIVTTPTTPAAGVKNDIIFVSVNQVYITDEKRRDVFISKNTSYTDFTFGTPRLPGQGGVLTLDSSPTAIVDQENAVYISAGKDDWYQVKFTLSDDLTKESLAIEKLKSGPQQAALSQESVGKIKNSVVYISNEPTFDSLGRVENINTPQARPISDPIKFDFDAYDFTNCHVKYYKNQTFITLPVEGIIFIYDHQNGYWQPPQTMYISRFAIIAGELYGHSSVVSETYKIFDLNAESDNGAAIENVANFAYRNFDKRGVKKRFDEYYHEGYIAANTTINVAYNYEYQGSRGVLKKKIAPINQKTLFSNSISYNTLGGNPFGQLPFGSTIEGEPLLKKFRTVHTLAKIAFYEYYVTYSSFSVGFRWQLLAQGPNVILSTADNIDIKS